MFGLSIKEKILKYYNKERDKIIMPSSLFFHYRHDYGSGNNNGLFFLGGSSKSPVFKNNGRYIKIKLVD